MKIMCLAILLTLVAGTAMAQDSSYADGYNAGAQSPNMGPPPNTSSDYYYGYVNAAEDANRDYQRQQEQQSYQPSTQPEPSYGPPSNSSSAGSE